MSKHDSRKPADVKVLLKTGVDGAGISNIEKTGTSGLVDTYTITFDDGRKTTFDVTNGSSIDTIEKTGTSGLVDTYTITLTNGETETFNVTNGVDGGKEYVYPETYGAVGDGVTDDYQAIVDAIDVCNTNGKTLYFSPGHKYKINSEIVISELKFDIKMDSPIIYNGSGVALTINKMLLKHVSFWLESELTVASTATAISFGETFLNEIKVRYIYNFQTAMIFSDQERDDFSGIGYNKFYIDRIYDCQYYIHVSGNCWFNENTFVGGDYGRSGSTLYPTSTAVTIATNNNFYSNSNYWLHTCVEGATVGFDFETANYNTVIDVRAELVPTICVFGNKSCMNHVTYVSANYNEAQVVNNASPNVVDFVNTENWISIYKSPYLPELPCNNNLFSYTDDKLVGFDGASITKVKFETNALTGMNCNGYPIGVLVDLNGTNTIGFKVDSFDDASRYKMFFFDENDNMLGENDVDYVIEQYYPTTSTGIGVLGWVRNGDVASGIISTISVDSKVKKIFIAPSGQQVKSFEVFGVKRFIQSGAIVENYRMPYVTQHNYAKGIDNIPNNVTSTGVIAINTGTSSNWGWRYNGSSWVALT